MNNIVQFHPYKALKIKRIKKGHYKILIKPMMDVDNTIFEFASCGNPYDRENKPYAIGIGPFIHTKSSSWLCFNLFNENMEDQDLDEHRTFEVIMEVIDPRIHTTDAKTYFVIHASSQKVSSSCSKKRPLSQHDFQKKTQH